jgi:hypothetical protein
MSTPIISKPSSGRKPTLKKSKSNLSMLAETPPHPLDSTISLPTPPPSTITSNTNHSSVSCSSSHSDSKTTIKIKVIYDSDNIIVIQVPRSIPFSELRTRIAQKFSEPMKKLLFLDTISSISSTATLDVPTVLINDEQDLSRLMHTKWNKLEKVTLKCTL